MNKPLKRFLIFTLAVCMLTSIAGCATTAENSTVLSTSAAVSVASDVQKTTAAETTVTNAEEIKIGFTISDLSNPIWVEMYQAMQVKSKEIGAELIVNDAKNDPNSQIEAIENFITMGCQAIIVHAFDLEASKPVIQEALDKGIKVVSYDVKIDGTDVYCGVDNYALGKVIGKSAGDWINSKLGGSAEVGVFGYPRISIIVERENGIKDGLRETSPNAKVVATATAGYTPEGVTEGENFLQAHPDMNVIVGINDGGILGAYEAFKAAGKTGDNIGLFGCDATKDALDAINEGGIYRSTIALDTVKAGADMVTASYNAATGKEYPKTILMEPTVVNIDNVKEYLK